MTVTPAVLHIARWANTYTAPKRPRVALRASALRGPTAKPELIQLERLL